MRYFLVISYDGSKFFGFQRQKSKRSVQGEIEEKLTNLFEEDIQIKGAGRTDRGVHANGQCVHFDVNKNLKSKVIKSYLNNNLKDIKVKRVRIVDGQFHSRFSVKRKHYYYKISFNSRDYDSDYVYYHKPLNIRKMKDAAKAFIGVHNFQNFVSGERENYECIIYKIKFCKFNNILTIHFYGKSFYRYMVRNMVGALIDVGKGKNTKEDIIRLLDSEKTDKMLSTAPAKGLTLDKIYY